MNTRRLHFRLGLGPLLGAALLVSLCVPAAPATARAAASPGAPPIVVSNLADSGPGSLRQAIAAANMAAGADTISIATTGTIQLSGQLDVTDSVTINGPGANLLTVDGQSLGRVFKITGAGNSVTLLGMTITGGLVTPAIDPTDHGGGILCNDASLMLVDCAVVGNRAGQGGGVEVNPGNATIVNCTIANNVSNTLGGGLIFFSPGTIALTNTTIAFNRAMADGGGIAAGSITATIANCTIAGNRANGGGGMLSVATSTTLRNTIVAGNTVTTTGPDYLNVFTSLGHNLIGNGSGATITNQMPSDIVGSGASPVDAKLGALVDNGGRTPTMAPLFGSPAIDAGDAGGTVTDERGAPRQVDGNGDGTAASDIGAFEVQRYIVKNTNGEGADSLRDAILHNEQCGASLVTFDIPGSGTHTIALATSLPSITKTIVIDGLSQSGATFDTPAVELWGGASVANGLTLSTSSSLVRSLRVSGFTGKGISVTGNGTGNRISHVDCYANGGPGIDLGGDGDTPNDPGDADTGPNLLQNAPVLASLTSAGLLSGSLDSLPGNATYPVTIELFESSVCSSTGRGEGEHYVASFDMAAPGPFTFSLTPNPSLAIITATATDARGNTSEFSNCVVLNSPPVVTASAVAAVRGGSATGVALATIVDADEASTALDVRINGGTAPVTVNGVTLSGFAVDGSGVLHAAVAADCAATNASFTVTATDGLGETGTATLTVTVLPDATPPSISCPADISVVASTIENQEMGAVVSFPAPSASDNCGGVTVACVPASGSFFPVGATTVTCTATDAAGNATSCTFQVVVTLPSGVCFRDDATGDAFFEVTDAANPLYKMWTYRTAGGRVFTGKADALTMIPGRSFTSYDRYETDYVMDANAILSTGTATVTVRVRATGESFTLRDRNINNNPPCS